MSEIEIKSVSEGICEAIEALGDAITTSGVSGGHDESGGHVTCLTESVMGVTAGLFAIAREINNLANVMGDCCANSKQTNQDGS